MPDIPVDDEILFDWLVTKPASILGIFIVAVIIRWLVHRLIDRLVHRQPKKRKVLGIAQPVLATMDGYERREQRAQAMGSLLKSITSVVIGATALIMVLDVFGLPIAPLLASAGVVGLAVGFGAQSIVKDVLAGISLILEDQYGVGDVIEVGEVTGTVESVGMRVTQLRDAAGTVWYVRNGEILLVGNQSQNWTRSILDVTISKYADIDQAIRLLNEVVGSVANDPQLRDHFFDAPTVVGVDRFDNHGVVLQVRFKTAPTKQWPVARAMRERIKFQFDKENIPLVTSNLSTSKGGTSW